MSRLKLLTVIIAVLISYAHCRKHHLTLYDDSRRLIHITTFGFYKGGFMEVKLSGMRLDAPTSTITNGESMDEMIGFSVYRTLNSGISPYSHNIDKPCALVDVNSEDDGYASILLLFNFSSNTIKVRCSPTLRSNVKIYKSTNAIPLPAARWPSFVSPYGTLISQTRKKRDADIKTNVSIPRPNSDKVTADLKPQNKEKEELLTSDGNKNDEDKKNSENKQETPVVQSLVEHKYDNPAGSSEIGECDNTILPLNHTVSPEGDGTFLYSTSFVIYIAGEDCEGLYNLYFHNCIPLSESVGFSLNITEENPGKNFLSAGEMPLPALYYMMSFLFFISGVFWAFILKKSKKETGVSVFKIHYLMCILVFLKSISLCFHATNYHFIQIKGTHVESWAILFYITHLLKGALLFTTILLIGTGYAFIKHLLSDKDKKIFMIVVPLQILANVAQIILEESEEGEIIHRTWRVIFISLDLFCCGAILFPVVWSIRHLQEASHTDGKAAINLKKLKLFRHFYIIVVCYIYFTRIIIQMLLKITVPFQYEWVTNMFLEMTTFIFFVLTGYKFRPARNNPYLQLGHDSDDEDMNVALTESGLTEGVSKRGPKAKKKTLKEIVLFDPNEECTDDDEEVLLDKRREDSHEFD